jgi:hypothetical protein
VIDQQLRLSTVTEILLEMDASDYRGYLIDGIADVAASNLQGDPFIGKTYMSLDLAGSLITGESFLGRQVLRPAEKVAFLFTDPGGQYALAERVKRAGLDTNRIIGAPFWAPRDLDGWKNAGEMLKNAGVDVAIIDNTTDVAEDANGPREVKAVTDGMRLWTESGISLLNINHLNKGGPWGKSGFGSVLWEKWSRCKLTLRGNPRSSRRTLQVMPNNAPASDFELEFNPDHFPAFTVRGEVEPVSKDRENRKTLEKNQEVAEWLVKNCQGIKNVSEVSRKLHDQFPDKTDGSHRQYLKVGENGKSKYPVVHDGQGGWSLRSSDQP